jgi:hypothetical protein
MLYVRYVHLIKDQALFTRDKHNLPSERMLHEDYERKDSAEKIPRRGSQGACRQDELIGCKPPVVK